MTSTRVSISDLPGWIPTTVPRRPSGTQLPEKGKLRVESGMLEEPRTQEREERGDEKGGDGYLVGR